MEINWIAVLAAAVSSFLLGGVWYGAVFERSWMHAAGMSPEQIKSRNLSLVFGGSFVLALIAAASFSFFVGPNAGAGAGALYGATAGACWVATSFGMNYLFEQKALGLFLINGGYHTAQFTLIGLILGAWG